MKKILIVLAATLALLVGEGVSASPTSAARCGSNNFVFHPAELTNRSIHWSWRADTVPGYLDAATTLQHARDAHTEWELSDTWCPNYGDTSGLNFTYDGTTLKSAGCNGVNTIGFGSLHDPPFNRTDNTSNLVGFTWLCYGSHGGCACYLGYPITEADIRLNNYDALNVWSNIGTGTIDVWNVIAHEIGHTIGSDHSASPDNVMYNIIPPGSNLSDRKLGRGDWDMLCVWYSNVFCVPR